MSSEFGWHQNPRLQKLPKSTFELMAALPGFCPTAKSPPWREIENSKSKVHVPEAQVQFLVEILKQHIEIVHIKC